MNRDGKTNNMLPGFLLPFICVCIFAVCALLMTAGGLRVYSGVVKSSGQVFSMRTGISYITMKLRQAAGEEQIAVGENRLVIEQEIDGKPYETHIYLEDGQLKESFVPAGMKAGSGTPIVDAAGFTITVGEDGMVLFTITDSEGNGESSGVYIGQAGNAQ
ncbi:MAG: DUF4860 domain-containing protein [Christensenellaceae bacterium]